MFCTPMLSVDMIKISGPVDLVNRSNVLKAANVRLAHLRQHHGNRTTSTEYKHQGCTVQDANQSEPQESPSWLTSLVECLSTETSKSEEQPAFSSPLTSDETPLEQQTTRNPNETVTVLDDSISPWILERWKILLR